MSAPKGNQYWKKRSSHGRSPIFANKEELLNACIEYFEHADANPLITYKPYVNKDGEVCQMETVHPRPYTFEGLTVFLDISEDCFREYEKRQDFIGVCKQVRQTIRDQKLSGAIAGFYNHAIVARDLKLRDTIDANVGGQEGNPLNIKLAAREMTPEEAIAQYNEFMQGK